MLYWPDPAHRQLMALDLHSGRAVSLLSGEDVAALAGVAKASVGPPIWSADRRYIAFRADVPWPRASKRFGTIAIARPDGRIFRLITSPYVVSMLAWSPREHRLAYTTSGFPDPHELIIVDGPGAAPRRVFGGTAHFDWATWSPDGRWVLIDDEDHKRWLILDAAGRKDARWLPRLGGRPQWCCPEGEWSASSGI